MQPLCKKFTQCSSITMLFCVFMILFSVSSTALTTFGKSNTNNQQQPTVPPVKGRECNSHLECSALQTTSCVKDVQDGKMRCLCGDNTSPINGQCTSKYKRFQHLCTTSKECEVGTICVAQNSTKTKGIGKLLGSTLQQDMKTCVCDEESGFEENLHDMTCSRGVSIISSLVTINLLILFILSFKHY